MLLTILLLLSALCLSSIAGFYSVLGMTAIFAASWWPIVIMTGTLEFSKVIVASWLYRNWGKTPLFLKSYFTVAVIILMFITSLGIFGFLSKAHIDQIASTSDNPLFIKQIDQQIATEQAHIDDNRKVIAQMDSAVNSVLSQSVSESAQRANKGSTMARQATILRDSQKKDRNSLNKSIDELNAKIRDLNKERLKLEQDQIKIEAEVGPIKYIAQMIYGNNLDKSLLEKAVQYVIIMIIMVFDPLAVLMIIAANMSMQQLAEDKKAKKIAENEDIELKKKVDEPILNRIIEPLDTSNTDFAFNLIDDTIDHVIEESIESVSDDSIAEPYSLESNVDNDITIIEEPVQELLYGNETEAPYVPSVVNKPDDVLQNIKKYHNVRLDDARRTLK